MLPWLQILTFSDGQITEELVTIENAIMLEPCEDLIQCQSVANRGALHTADYKIEDQKISFYDIAPTGLVFERAEGRAHIEKTALVTEGTVDSTLLENGVLIARRNGQIRRYLPFEHAALTEVLGLTLLLDASLSEKGECLLKGHYARRSLAENERSPMQASLLALSELGAEDWDRRDLEIALTKNRALFIDDLQDAERRTLEQVYFENRMSSVALTALMQSTLGRFEQTGSWARATPDAEELAQLKAELLTPLEDMTDEETKAIRLTQVEAAIPKFRAAAPAAAALYLTRTEPAAWRALVCP